MKKLLPYIASIAFLLFGKIDRALAQNAEFGTDALSGLSTASTRDVFDTVVSIVNLVLYFLGGIAVLLGLYAGWLWFTSRGNADQIRKAKSIMVSAVIGLLIIFSSYAITNFVIDNLYRNTIGGEDTLPPGGGSGGDGSSFGCLPPTTAGAIKICSFSSKRVGEYVTIAGWNFGDYVDTATSKVSFVESISSVVTSATLVSCGSTPYWVNTGRTSGTNVYYKIKVVVPSLPNVDPGNSYNISVENNGAQDTKSGFSVLAGTPGLNIACLLPDYGPTGTTVTAQGINFGTIAGTRSINMTGWNGTAAAQIPVTFSDSNWSDTSITFDIPNNALSSQINISNSEINGGAPDSEDFKVTCSGPSNCASNCCTTYTHECRPLNICSGTSTGTSGLHISYISPDNGKEDNLVTIQGSGFGTPGTVTFTDQLDTNIHLVAQLPSSINTSCTDLWTDNEIIVGLPAVVSGHTYLVTVLPSGATTPSNGVSFSANDITRPGICGASRNTGSFGTPVTITGVNFVDAPGNTVKYGGFAGGNVSITVPSSADSTVPNLAAGLVGIQINAGTELSNPYSFAVTEAIVGDPNIVNITPENGPTGTYVTINGTNFGSTRNGGKVVFEQGASSIDGSFDFPLQCSNSVWSSSRIIVKVPGIATVGDYEVKVIRSDAKTSNTKTFEFTNGTPAPGLCAIFPDNGPKNSLVSFYGDNFDQANSQIKFYNNQSTRGVVGTAIWGDNSALFVAVPNGAETGPVVVTSGTQDSNAFNFRVGSCSNNNNCPSGQTCCQNPIGNYCATSCSNTRQCTYGWTFTTEATPPADLEVVKHWPACDSSCGNAAIGLGFNLPVLDSTATDTNNYEILDVTDGSTIVINSIDLVENIGAEVPAEVTLRYAGSLQVDHTYRVSVDNGVQSEEGSTTTYSWEFTVKQGSCAFTGVNISPANYTALRPNQTINYSAYPTANAGACGEQILKCDAGCSYAWNINTANIATITSGASARDMKAKSTANTTPPTIVGSENVQCTITKDSNNVTATPAASLSINYSGYLEGLYMVAHYPECDNACLNSVVGLRFNSELDTASISNINSLISIRDLTSGALVTNGVTVTTNIDDESIVTIGHLPFVTGDRYEVTVSNQIRNVFGNAFAGATWQFSVGTQECTVTGADIIPAAKTIAINKTVTYTAQTVSNTISCGRIPVNCSSCSYNWSVANPSVASITGNTQRSTVNTLAIGTTNIDCRITQTVAPNNIDAAPAVLTVTAPAGPVYRDPEIEDFSPDPGSLNQCINTAIEILFTEKMNLTTVSDNLKLYDASNNLVAGTYSFATVDGNAYPGPTNNQTRVIFSPNALLAANSTYHISLGTGIPPAGMLSINGLGLNLASAPAALQNNVWTFTTGTEVCKISYAVTSPSADSFTCGGNTCEGDDVTTTNGNQHNYTVAVYSRYGTTISGAGLNYQWTVSPNEDSVSLINKTSVQTTATAGNNGQAAVSVTVSGTISGVNLGSASASLPVNVFLCEHPWPNISSFPWIENNLNFSSYYCQQFDDSSPALPYLHYPPAMSSNPDIASGKILAEYIFAVNINSTTAKTNNLGSLAYYAPSTQKATTNIWQKLSSLMAVSQVQGQVIPVLPSNIAVATNGSVVTVNWSNPANWRDTEYFAIQRKLSTASNWATLQTIYVADPATVPSSYVDSSITMSGTYDYRLVTCVDVSTCINGSTFSIPVSVSANTETNFIIFRVMPNAGHLSVKEWYKEKFPGDALGTMTTVDGYEAMQVGNTMYISAANIAGNKIYTNIYIIAYSVGANAQTKSIYDQFVNNFKLNTNVGFSNNNDDNLCSNEDKVCSSNLDCGVVSGVQGYCRSRSLKIRRDVKRLTDILPVQKYLATYGASHKACSGNSQVSCTTDSQCGSSGPCVNYYPQLNAGTFVAGKTTSKWPSWQQTLASDLRQTLPVDPLNKFTTCPNSGADPETCWNEVDRTFECTDDSYIYGYLLENAARDYQIYSNFEYDGVRFGPSFANDLYNSQTSSGVNALGNISTNLSNFCSATPVLPGTNLCGNGLIDAGEICDGGINYSQCSATLGVHPWWNEQVSGCNPPGTPGQCTWYAPTLTAAMCGGYCGDGALQTSYENCDTVSGSTRYNGTFSCNTGDTLFCNGACNAICDSAVDYPAAKCGDGVLSAGEACDPTANPNGLTGWDCSLNGNIACGLPNTANACKRICDVGTPYAGRCGDGNVQAPELCDPGSNTRYTPADATGNPAYTCSQSCDFSGQPYCGDNILQLSYGEKCDTNPLAPILPAQSRIDNQYQCRMTNDTTTDPRFTRCTLTAGGYCGDGITQDGTGGTYNAGEKCDPLGYVVDATHPSSITHQYTCTTACQTTGGYCGDGVFNSTQEECDASAGLTGWGCTLNGTISCGASGTANACKRVCSVGVPYTGQCGNNIVEAPEQCDGNEVACRDISTQYAGGYTACSTNTCTAESTAGCCTTNSLSAKFMVDNEFSLYVNGVKIGSGQNWKTCSNADDPNSPYDAGILDDNGVCEFNINNTSLFNYDHAENVLAFSAVDTGVAAGVVGTFSCQATTCHSICYKGSNAGQSCSNAADCPSGTCISPGAPAAVGTSCLRNNDCHSPEPTVSLCLPADYGITTKVTNSLWKCTDTPQSSLTWTETGFDDSSWVSPQVAPHPTQTADNWWDSNQVWYWKHMVPGAEPIWLGGIGSVSSPRTVYCRYVVRGYGSSLPTPDTQAPTVPTNLNASATSNQISLSWTASTDNVAVTGYKIFRSVTSGSGYAQIGTSGTPSYTDGGLQNRIYYYVVQAYDANGNSSANSNQAFAQVDTQAPTAPTGLTAVPSGTQVALNWTASTDNVAVTGYNILRSTINGGPYTQINTSNTTSYTDSGLALGTYYYVVQAYDANGNTSGVSSQAVAIMDLQPPTVPSNVQATPSNNRITLTWNASTDPEGSAVTYIVERATALAGPFASVATVGTATFADTGVINGTQYFYQIKARDTSNNQSAYSTPIVSATPDNNTVAPNPATLLSVIADSALKVMTLNWAAPLSGPMVVSYIIERSLTATFDSVTAIGTSFGTSFVDNFSDGLVPQLVTNYYYRIRAVGTLGLQSVSNVVSSFFPDNIAPSPAPSALNARFMGTYVALTWTGSNDNIGVTNYIIQRGTSASGPFTTTVSGASTSYNDSSFSADTTYYYQVAARDAAGNTSSYSTQVNVLTRDTEAPTGTLVLSGTNTDPIITLSWTGVITDNVGVTNYIIKRSNVATGPFTTTVGTPAASPFQDTSATLGSTYYYQVAAQDAVGNTSAYSNTASATSFNGPGKPVISNINVATFSVSLTLNSSGGVNPRYFTVERANISSPSNFVVIAPNVTAAVTGATLYQDSTVLGSTTYYYRVKCTDANNTVSEYSDVSTVVTLDSTPPVCPGPFTAVSSSGSITLSWPACTDNIAMAGYVIERSINGGAWSRLPNSSSPITTTGTTYVDVTTSMTGVLSAAYRFRPVDTSGNTTGWSTQTTYVCNVAYCDQFDADPATSCLNSCQAIGHCCQPCYSATNAYLGCRPIDPALAACQTVTLSSGTCR